MPLTPEEEKRLREDIQKELEKREMELRENKEHKEEERRRKLEKQLREKIRKEEEEKYFIERGYVRYINHQGLVEWLTQQEAEQRKKTRRSKRGSSKHKKHQKKRIIQIVSNIGIILVAGMILLFVYKFNPSGGTSYGSIIVNSDVPGCKIFLDGTEVNSFTPHTLNKVSPGIHFISVYKEGFSAWPPMTSVSVPKNKTIFADFTLNHSTFLGEIIIESNLAGYDLYVDGQRFEMTDSRLQIPTGYHVIALVKAGYFATPSYQRVLVEKDGMKILKFQFNPDENIGYLQISSNRKNEYIYLDGRFTGVKAQGKLLPVKAGTYEISTRENGYLTTPESRILNLLPDEKKLVVFHSIPISERNSVNITTSLPGAAIILNGDWTSFVTPARNLELSPGSHYINLMRGDSVYSAKDMLVDIAQLKNKSVRINF
jgi:PEGA domain